MCALVKDRGLDETLEKPWKLLCRSEAADLPYVCIKPSSQRAGWKHYTCYGHSVLSKIPLWTWKPKLWPLSACQNLGDNSYSSDSHCAEHILPQADIVLTQWSSLPKTLVWWCLLWGWQSLYGAQPELPGSKGRMCTACVWQAQIPGLRRQHG